MIFTTLEDVANELRNTLNLKKYVLLYAYNGTGKTRLSMVFKELGRTAPNEPHDTLYFNAFTEDLFTWDNDLDGNSERVLKLNAQSRFFAGLEEFAMEDKIKLLLERYADFNFKIDYDKKEPKIIFSREVKTGNNGTETIDNIKISRGEENIFIWCFFLAIVELAISSESKSDPYNWVKYVYIDDPISSLDENNTISVAHHLVQLLNQKQYLIDEKGQKLLTEKGEALTTEKDTLKVVISSHHTLFFSVLYNELKRKSKNYFLIQKQDSKEYILQDTTDTPFFYHIAILAELKKASESGNLFTYHFNMLRVILEKTAHFHGHNNFSACIKSEDAKFHSRAINILSHGNYSMYEPREMAEDNKVLFNTIFDTFIKEYDFNPELFNFFNQETT
jgi:wobble nucleotide-excising tRNase